MNWKWGVPLMGCCAVLAIVGAALAVALFLLFGQIAQLAPSIVSGVESFTEVKDRVDPAFEKWDRTNDKIEEGVKAIKEFKLFRDEREGRK